MPKTAAEMVAEAKQRVENLTLDEAAEEMKNGALVIDIREPEERQHLGRIPRSVAAPRGMLEFWADPTSQFHREEFNPERRIILHCATGGRSALAADTLEQMGYTNVAHMDGGFNAWKESGREIKGGTIKK